MNSLKQYFAQVFQSNNSSTSIVDERESLVCNYEDDYYGDQVCITESEERDFQRKENCLQSLK